QRLEAQPKPRGNLRGAGGNVLDRCWDTGVLARRGKIRTDRLEVAAIQVAPEALDELAVASGVTHRVGPPRCGNLRRRAVPLGVGVGRASHAALTAAVS